MQLPENPSADIKFEKLKPLCKSEGEFKDVTLKISLLEIILSQVHEVFVSSLYHETTGITLIEASNKSLKRLQENLAETYVTNSVEVGELMPIPGIEEATLWVQEIHHDIASQLYSEGFMNSVFHPALATLSTSIIEFSKEEAQLAQQETSNNKGNI